MAVKKKDAAEVDGEAHSSTRMDRLVAMIDHCKAAKQEADKLDEKFLAYLLAMAIQECQSRMPATH